MNNAQLHAIKTWFTSYTATFAATDGRFIPPLQLKVDHSKRVADNARKLAEDLGWNLAEVNCAEALGWLHDVGRFSQFLEFGTFLDSASINHGERGWKIVRESESLCTFALEEQAALLDGIRYHNAKTEPDHLTEESQRFLKLIRDADKLDIYHIVLDSIEMDGFQELPDMLPQVVLDDPASPKILCEIRQHRSCSIEDVRSLADFLLLQLSWIYDLNYPASLRLVSERNIIGQLEQALPKEKQIEEIVQAARRFAEQGLAFPVESKSG